MTARAPRFWQEPWLIGVLLVACPPLGLVLLLRTPEATRTRKALALLGLTFLALVLIGMEADTGGASKALRRLRTEIWLQAGRGLLRGGAPGWAAQAAARARALAPEPYRAAWLQTRAARELGDREAARSFLADAVVEEGKLREAAPPLWLVAYGHLCLEAGEVEEVDRVLEVFTGVRAKRAGAPLLRAARLRGQGRLREAEEQARTLVDDFVLARLGEAYWEIAAIAAARGDPLRAAYFALESFRHGAPVPEREVREQLGQWCQQAGVPRPPAMAFLRALSLRGPFGARGRPTDHESEVADRICERLLERDPDFWAGDLVLHTRGSHAFYQLEDYPRAAAFYEAVLRDYPRAETRCRCSYQLARAHQEQEQWGKAEIQAQRAIEACPGDLGVSARGLLNKIRRQRLADEDPASPGASGAERPEEE